MKFSAQEEFGLRCMVQMARTNRGPVNIVEIAQRESLTPAYVGKLMCLLRRAGLVRSIRGQKGGYELAQPATEISVAEILMALGDRLYSPELCTRYAGHAEQCVHTTDCTIRSLWSGIDRIVYSVLEGCKLAQMAASESQVDALVSQHFAHLPQIRSCCPKS